MNADKTDEIGAVLLICVHLRVSVFQMSWHDRLAGACELPSCGKMFLRRDFPFDEEIGAAL
jgi:hypothetical protein